MPVEHVNRKGDTYYLHQGRTKTGKPKYFTSRKSDGKLCDEVPDGFEIYENAHAQVFCRRIVLCEIAKFEIESVKEQLKLVGKDVFTFVEAQGKNILILEGNNRELEEAYAGLVDHSGRSATLIARQRAAAMARYHELLKFTLVDVDERLFEASRWCWRGTTDDWLPLMIPPKPLQELVESLVAHIGEESFFELM